MHYMYQYKPKTTNTCIIQLKTVINGKYKYINSIVAHHFNIFVLRRLDRTRDLLVYCPKFQTSRIIKVWKFVNSRRPLTVISDQNSVNSVGVPHQQLTARQRSNIVRGLSRVTARRRPRPNRSRVSPASPALPDVFSIAGSGYLHQAT